MSALKRPSAAPVNVKKEQAEEQEQETNNKYDAAMLLTQGDEELSRAVVNIDRTHNNQWKNAIHGSAPQELRDEWQAVSTCGFGNQKRLNLY